MVPLMINSTIRSAIDAIAAKYQGGERAWLQERNPVVLRQLDALEAKVDAAALAGDPDGVRRACKVWQQTWEFWCGNFKRGL